MEGPGGLSGKALGNGPGGPCSIPGIGGVEVFLHSFVSRLVQGAPQHPICEPLHPHPRGSSWPVMGIPFIKV